MRKIITGLAASVVALAALQAGAQGLPPIKPFDPTAAAQPPAEAEAPAPPPPDRFTTEQLQPMIHRAGSDCQIAGKSQINVTETRAYYELSCAGGYGEVAIIVLPESDTSPISIIACANASQSNYTCNLTPAEANQSYFSQRTAELTALARAKGFDCEVKSYIPYPRRPNQEFNASEITCENRPEAAVALSGGGLSEVMHCGRAQADGFRCATERETWAAATTADLHKSRPGASSCIVADSQLLGRSATDAYLEVTCTDGLLGYVIKYPLMKAEPTEAIGCVMATGIAGGCRMPGNELSGES